MTSFSPSNLTWSHLLHLSRRHILKSSNDHLQQLQIMSKQEFKICHNKNDKKFSIQEIRMYKLRVLDTDESFCDSFGCWRLAVAGNNSIIDCNRRFDGQKFSCVTLSFFNHNEVFWLQYYYYKEHPSQPYKKWRRATEIRIM